MTSLARMRPLLGWAPTRVVVHLLDSLVDLWRFARFSAPNHGSTRNRQKLEALLFLNYHKIEKTLALREVPRLFGLGYLGRLMDLMDIWLHVTGDPRAVAFRGACEALSEYRGQVGNALGEEHPELLAQLDDLLEHHLGVRDESAGGTIRVDAPSRREVARETAFARVVQGRHSVRHFTDEFVPDDVIRRAVELARRSPSVCNRQSWRVHVYTQRSDKERVLRTQDGNAGFGHLADRVLLICADLRTFVATSERHQPYTDAGMFAMTLILGLESQGVASCCLNVCDYSLRERKLRKACGIPQWEVPVMMIAIGYAPKRFKVAASPRIPLEFILRFRDLGAE